MEQSRKKELIAAYRQRKVIGCVYEVRCAGNGRCLVRPDADRKGAKNRFDFAVTTGSCLMAALQEDWARYGADSFSFRVVETLEKKEDQSDKEFAGDLAVLAEMTRENYDPNILYP